MQGTQSPALDAAKKISGAGGSIAKNVKLNFHKWLRKLYKKPFIKIMKYLLIFTRSTKFFYSTNNQSSTVLKCTHFVMDNICKINKVFWIKPSLIQWRKNN